MTIGSVMVVICEREQFHMKSLFFFFLLFEYKIYTFHAIIVVDKILNFTMNLNINGVVHRHRMVDVSE